MLAKSFFGLLSLALAVGAFQDAPPAPFDDEAELARKWGFDYAFSGVSTFAHLPYTRCLTAPNEPFDIGIIGAPFDTAVSYRPGARFGPRAIRAASARQIPYRAFNPRAGINPYTTGLVYRDCGDIPITPFDNAVALRQMTEAYEVLGRRSPASSSPAHPKPKLLSLGGDHSIALAALRALNHIHGQQIAVLHFDAHLDTWHPAKYPSAWLSEQAHFNHGSMFWLASEEGLILHNRSVHAGLRTRLTDLGDWEDDDGQGFMRIHADDIDEMEGGPRGVAEAIVRRIGRDVPVYLSLDIDVLDPGLCPGTGTPEAGGWTSREVIRILRGLEELNVVGADIVEVAPAYDGAGEQTALVASQVGYEIITNWAKQYVRLNKEGGQQAQDEGKDEL